MKLALSRYMPRLISIILFTVTYLASVSSMLAQDATKDNLEWTASSLRDLATNEEFNVGCQFVTDNTGKIRWIQDNGKSVSQLNITSTIGTWPNINNEGTIKYKFSDGSLSGELVLAKKGSQWVAELTILGGTDDIRLRYSISSVKKI